MQSLKHLSFQNQLSLCFCSSAGFQFFGSPQGARNLRLGGPKTLAGFLSLSISLNYKELENIKYREYAKGLKITVI